MMNGLFLRIAISFLLGGLTPIGGLAGEQPAVVAHRLQILLDPQQGSLEISDQLSLPVTTGAQRFRLGRNFEIEEASPPVVKAGSSGPFIWYSLSEVSNQLRLRYRGRLDNRFDRIRENLGKHRLQSDGFLSPQGIFASAASGWFAAFPDTLQRFRLRARIPADWQLISQGDGPQEQPAEEPQSKWVAWRTDWPQDDIYLVGGPLHPHRRDLADGIQAQVYLRQPDAELAGRYLDATARYLQDYQELLGTYPYGKFALVENFWETGYGMPSFTLLGPRVIRLPFILHSSYPHEILHNWWGNGVFIDGGEGNWAEGLTSYLADQRIQERQGRGREHRRDALLRFGDYAGEDYPLSAFRSRREDRSQAVGYDKGMMFWHMLRLRLGDPAFFSGLRLFYRQQRFRYAGYSDIRAAMEQASGADLESFFRLWLNSRGAPELVIEDWRLTPAASGWKLQLTLAQRHPQAALPLTIPYRVELADGSQQQGQLTLDQARDAFSIALRQRPLRLTIDPDWDLFRQLDPAERPTRLADLMRAEDALLLLPASAADATLSAWRDLATAWQQDGPMLEIALDRDFGRLPEQRAIWLLGAENRHRQEFLAELQRQELIRERQDDALLLDGERLSLREDLLLSLTAPGGQPRAWVLANDPAAIARLTRKLPHYGKYSYLAFSRPDTRNRVKGQWVASRGPLSIDLTAAP